MSSRSTKVLRFRISLNDIAPAIWRVVDVPQSYSFWDLHVAIQDAMGWLDYHLHTFVPAADTESPRAQIGIPDEGWDDGTMPGWKLPITRHFTQPGDVMVYEYDFGDGWSHTVELLDTLPKEKGARYPRCVDGARACPPEDCGGVSGYFNVVAVLADPSGPEYRDTITWLKGHAKNYHPYDPDAFDPAAVKFSNPKRRFQRAFGPQ